MGEELRFAMRCRASRKRPALKRKCSKCSIHGTGRGVSPSNFGIGSTYVPAGVDMIPQTNLSPIPPLNMNNLPISLPHHHHHHHHSSSLQDKHSHHLHSSNPGFVPMLDLQQQPHHHLNFSTARSEESSNCSPSLHHRHPLNVIRNDPVDDDDDEHGSDTDDNVDQHLSLTQHLRPNTGGNTTTTTVNHSCFRHSSSSPRDAMLSSSTHRWQELSLPTASVQSFFERRQWMNGWIEGHALNHRLLHFSCLLLQASSSSPVTLNASSSSRIPCFSLFSRIQLQTCHWKRRNTRLSFMLETRKPSGKKISIQSFFTSLWRLKNATGKTCSAMILYLRLKKKQRNTLMLTWIKVLDRFFILCLPTHILFQRFM